MPDTLIPKPGPQYKYFRLGSLSSLHCHVAQRLCETLVSLMDLGLSNPEDR